MYKIPTWHSLPAAGLFLPLSLTALVCLPLSSEAREFCGKEAMVEHPPQINFRVDNDLLGGRHQDQGYTNGAQLTLVSPNLVDYTDDPCLPEPARRLNRYLERFHPGQFEEQNMIFSIGQGIFTPTDFSREDLIEDDRPYAGVLVVNFGYNARRGNRLQTTQLTFGVVGPWAKGKQVQNAVHDLLGDEKFRGWDNQLHNEPALMYTHERMRRWPADASTNAGGWGWDAISHYGGSVGNLKTKANFGGEVRLGWKLPDDFGSTPLRPAGENTAPTRVGKPSGWSWHLFAATDAAWVIRDITLDGNTFRNSHSVDKRHVVAYGGYGVALIHGRWKLAMARYHSTREFNGQREAPVFGSFTITRSM